MSQRESVLTGEIKHSLDDNAGNTDDPRLVKGARWEGDPHNPNLHPLRAHLTRPEQIKTSTYGTFGKAFRLVASIICT